MDGSRDELFACAALAGDENKGVARGDARHEAEYLLHGFALADDVAKAVLAFNLALQMLDAPVQLSILERLVCNDDELFKLEGLGDVVERSELHRLDRRFDGTEGGNHHDVRGLTRRLDIADEVKAVDIGHAQVGYHQVDGMRENEVHAGSAIGGSKHIKSLVTQLLHEEVAHGIVIFDDENLGATAK